MDDGRPAGAQLAVGRGRPRLEAEGAASGRLLLTRGALAVLAREDAASADGLEAEAEASHAREELGEGEARRRGSDGRRWAAASSVVVGVHSQHSARERVLNTDVYMPAKEIIILLEHWPQ